MALPDVMGQFPTFVAGVVVKKVIFALFASMPGCRQEQIMGAGPDTGAVEDKCCKVLAFLCWKLICGIFRHVVVKLS